MLSNDETVAVVDGTTSFHELTTDPLTRGKATASQKALAMAYCALRRAGVV